jgi:hypothetical protein
MMANVLIRAARSFVRGLGFDVVRYRRTPLIPPLPADIDAAAAATIHHVQPYTMTSPERIYALIQAVRYVSATAIPGDIVECGVWRGGSMMAAALTLIECKDIARELFLFDTFEGMSAPGARDVDLEGRLAGQLLGVQDRNDPKSVWCYAPLADAQAAMARTGYPAARTHFLEGKVEETIPERAPARIAILRLDTDWYESTRHELEHLYPRLVPGGVLIIDDYGHWKGAREAVDEYLRVKGLKLLLNRIDYSGRIAVKPE